MSSNPFISFGASFLIFLILYRSFAVQRRSETYVQNKSDEKYYDKVLHVVFIGDSLTRYQYLTIAYKFLYGSDSVVPRKLVNEKLHASWTEFFRYSTNLFQKHMFCDCFRTENLSRKLRRSVNELNANGIGLSKTVRNKSFHEEYGVLNKIRENRYFHHRIEVDGKFVHLNLTYLQFFGDKPSAHGRRLPGNIASSTIDSRIRHSKWAFGQLNDLLKYYVSILIPAPTHIILSTGAHYHNRMMANVELSLKVALNITPNVYWKQAPPLKNDLFEARKVGDANFSLPWDIDILAHDKCRKLYCYFISFPDALPDNLIFDKEHMIPEYFDETHFTSPELYVFWSAHVFHSEHFELFRKIFPSFRV